MNTYTCTYLPLLQNNDEDAEAAIWLGGSVGGCGCLQRRVQTTLLWINIMNYCVRLCWGVGSGWWLVVFWQASGSLFAY